MEDRRALEEEERRRRRAYLTSPMNAQLIFATIRHTHWFGELTEEEATQLEQILSRVEAVAKSLGQDFNLKVAPGEEWAYDPESNTVTVPLDQLLRLPPERAVALALHEAGHRRMTRLVAQHFFQPESRRLLLNGVEDPRVNNWMMREYAGVKKGLVGPLYDELYPKEPKSPVLKAVGKHLPHVQFILGLIYRWAHGEECPTITNSKVRDALAQTGEAVERAYSTLPTSFTPTEREIWEAAKEAVRIVIDEVWPVYQKLVEESVQIVEQGLREGTIQISAEGLPLGLSADELSELARQMVEEASGELADVLGGKVPRPDLAQLGRYQGDIGPVTQPSEEKGPLEEAFGEVGVEEAKAREETGDVIINWFLRQKASNHALQRYKQSFYTPYSKYLDKVAREVEELAGFLEAILLPNAAPKKEGYFRSGTAVDIKRLLQKRASGDHDQTVFLRRIRPTKRDYRFSLLLDESGSMNDGRKDFNAICATVLFMEVLQRLEIPHEVAGFSDIHIVHKGYYDQLTAEAKDEVIAEIERSMGQGSTHDVEAVEQALDRLAEEPGDVKYILVVTDGDGNGPGEMENALCRAKDEGVRVIGIGVGEGVDRVQHQYEEYVLVPRISDLPSAVGRKIEEAILWA